MLVRYYVYILECADDSFYTGITSRLEARIIEHNSDDEPNSYCHKRRPVKLVFAREFRSVNKAIAYEKQVKRWSRAKKIALITGAISELKKLAECRNESHCKNKGHGSAPLTMT